MTAKASLKRRLEEDEFNAAVLAYSIGRMQRQGAWPLVDSLVLERILRTVSLPAPAEQAESFILWLGETQRAPGGEVTVRPGNLRAVVGALNEEGVHFLLDALDQESLIHRDVAAGQQDISLTFRGWQRYADIKHRQPTGRTAFAAMPFGKDDLDHVFETCFKPAVEAADFRLLRLDEAPPAGLIDARLCVEIRRARFLIADLTWGNSGAYWEAGFAEGLDKLVIYTCEKAYFENAGTHFDTSHLTTVLWEADSLGDARRRLTATIRATLPAEAKLDDDEGGAS